MMASKHKINEGSSEAVQRKRPAGPNGDEDKDKYFMSIALLFAKKSPDPNTQVGACIVSEEGNIVGVGYNKMPNGCEDKGFTWDSDPQKKPNKYIYVCHAELNAIMNKTSADVKGCTIYVTLFPCNECAKILIQSGLKSVVYLSNKYGDRVETKASLDMQKAAGITIRQFKAKDKVKDLLSSINPDSE